MVGIKLDVLVVLMKSYKEVKRGGDLRSAKVKEYSAQSGDRVTWLFHVINQPTERE